MPQTFGSPSIAQALKLKAQAGNYVLIHRSSCPYAVLSIQWTSALITEAAFGCSALLRRTHPTPIRLATRPLIPPSTPQPTSGSWCSTHARPVRHGPRPADSSSTVPSRAYTLSAFYRPADSGCGVVVASVPASASRRRDAKGDVRSYTGREGESRLWRALSVSYPSAQHNITSIATLHTKARPEAQAQQYEDYDARSVLKHHCTTSPFSAAPLLTPARATHCGGSGQLFRG
ncbi:hypothetical protein C8R44DRAFT_894245 [Mycena epipterygia]|nr:hypothetical protein C8R44DRAFT_894245 [Mycena epipterygia]